MGLTWVTTIKKKILLKLTKAQRFCHTISQKENNNIFVYYQHRCVKDAKYVFRQNTLTVVSGEK